MLNIALILGAFAVIAWLLVQFAWPRRGSRPSADNNWSQGNPDRDRSLDNQIPSPASRTGIDGGGLG